MSSLVADYGSSASESEENAESSESSDENGDEDQSKKQPDKNDRPKLPVPSFQSTNLGSSSVFSNPFREEEDAQSSILERHVKMTTPVSQQTTVNGKQICWNYRKGRCRFGHNCKYVHDSDVVGLSGSTQDPEPAEPEVVAASAAAVGLSGSTQAPEPAEPEVVAASAAAPCKVGSEGTSQKHKKKRPGLSDSVTPSKKAMKFYHKTQGKS
uniref:C3H1-type domain-containing protein n=1 Tax=Rhipicephalus pulchellus TaxID=72859 RepID=L7LS23_RHIPC